MRLWTWLESKAPSAHNANGGEGFMWDVPADSEVAEVAAVIR